MLALAVLVSLAAGAFAQSPFFTGNGGKGLSLAILAPNGVGLAADQAYLPALVQGEFVSNFSAYSAITVLDRVKLDEVFAETLSGYYKDDAEGVVRLGHMTQTGYVMTGSITKTSSGYALQMQIASTADGMVKASYSGACTIAELDNLTGVRRASADLLGKLGVALTALSKNELGGAADRQSVASQTALAKGIEAMKQGTAVEALAYFIQSSSIDPQLAEAASRMSIVSGSITSGSIGTDLRNEIAWRKAWIARLNECDQFVANYIKNTPVFTFLVYSTDLQMGEIDWDKETIPISFDVVLMPNKEWSVPLTGVVDTVYEGLMATGRAAAWKLDWPTKSASGGVSPVTAETSVKYTVVVELVNEQRTVIGRQTVILSAGWKTGFRDGKMRADSLSDSITVKLPTVDANKLGDRQTIRVATINGANVETFAQARGVAVVGKAEYEVEYGKLEIGKYIAGGIRVDANGCAIAMPEGEFFIQSVHAQEGSLGGIWDIAGSSSYQSGLRIRMWWVGPGSEPKYWDYWDVLYHFVALGDGWYNIMARGNHPVDVKDGQDGNGVPLLVWDAHGGNNQKFRFKVYDDGSFNIYTFWGRTIHTATAGDSIHTWDDLPEGHRDIKNELWRLVDPQKLQ